MYFKPSKEMGNNTEINANLSLDRKAPISLECDTRRLVRE